MTILFEFRVYSHYQQPSTQYLLLCLQATKFPNILIWYKSYSHFQVDCYFISLISVNVENKYVYFMLSEQALFGNFWRRQTSYWVLVGICWSYCTAWPKLVEFSLLRTAWLALFALCLFTARHNHPRGLPSLQHGGVSTRPSTSKANSPRSTTTFWHLFDIEMCSINQLPK